VPNTFLSNHMPFYASTIDDYRRLTPVATPPEKGLYMLAHAGGDIRPATASNIKELPWVINRLGFYG